METPEQSCTGGCPGPVRSVRPHDARTPVRAVMMIMSPRVLFRMAAASSSILRGVPVATRVLVAALGNTIGVGRGPDDQSDDVVDDRDGVDTGQDARGGGSARATPSCRDAYLHGMRETAVLLVLQRHYLAVLVQSPPIGVVEIG